MTTKLTKSNSSILKEEGIKILDFWASWCGPCKTLKPKFESVSNNDDYSNIKFITAKVDEDDYVKQLAVDNGVRKIPTLAIIDSNGELIKKVNGMKTEEDIINIIKNIV
jgi:thioredoxin 1